MKSEGYGGRAGGGSSRDYSKPVQRECWLHGEVECDDCTEKGRVFARPEGGYGKLDDADDQWTWQDDQLVTAPEHMTLDDLSLNEAALDDLASDVDAVERGTLTYDEFVQTWGDEVADEFLPAHAYESSRSLVTRPMGASTSLASTARSNVTKALPTASWKDWKPGDPYPVTYYGTAVGKKYKPFWSAALSMEYARSLSAKSRSIGRRRDRQAGYRSCPAGRHWGPVGASGILPYAVKDDGRIYVALGKRSKAVQHGGTWAQFGGAIDKKDGGDFDAAYREINEEVEGLKGLFDEDDIVGEFRWDCPAGCGWHYTMFAVRVHAPGGRLPKLAVNKKAGSSWETDMLAWVPIDVVTQLELHDGFKRGWDRARKAIEETEEAIRATDTELQEAGQ
jgi:8-oxo-dGTP pyrophosphatase MutT (NUDIX family)